MGNRRILQRGMGSCDGCTRRAPGAASLFVYEECPLFFQTEALALAHHWKLMLF
ncbi:hypothetical protein TRIUR3_15110 [Triticum urartu]|uniref:Uncharacterized protein n=1 Tax=Triticum urartu TaxID=4572 RepID=M7YTE9_TRIUA|nr:hypothetical protein TRIUR3_15110 [Triticum urartu]